MPGSLRLSIKKLVCEEGAVHHPYAELAIGLKKVRAIIPVVEPDAEAATPKLSGGPDEKFYNLNLNAPGDRFLITVFKSDQAGSEPLGLARIYLEAGKPSLLEQCYLSDDGVSQTVNIVKSTDGKDQVVGSLTLIIKYFLQEEEEFNLNRTLDQRWEALKNGPQDAAASSNALGDSKRSIKQKLKDGLHSFVDLIGSLGS